MAKADLRIVLDKEDRCYVGGERIRGSVHVRVDSDCRCKGLSIERGWRTHGRGNRDTGSTDKLELYAGEWRAGQEQVYPFEFVAHGFPATYHGHYVNIDWYLTARADLPWATDPKHEVEYLVEPGPSDPAPVEHFPKEETLGNASGVAIGCIVAIGLPFIVLGFFNLPIGAIFMAIGFVIVGFGLRNVIAERRLGKISVSCEPKTITPGQDVRVKVDFQPRAAVELRRATLTLAGVEKVTSGSGTNKKTHTHELVARTITLSESEKLSAGSKVMFETSLPIPKEAPFSFTANSNNINWTLSIHLDIERWPDWNSSMQLRVLPGALVSAAARATWNDEDLDNEDLDDEDLDDEDLDDEDLEDSADLAGDRAETPEGHGVGAFASKNYLQPFPEAVVKSVDAAAGGDLVRSGRATAADASEGVIVGKAWERSAQGPPTVADDARIEAGAAATVPMGSHTQASSGAGSGESVATSTGTAELAEWIRKLAKAPAYDDQRGKILAEVRERRWNLSLEVDRVSWTSGMDVPAAMQGGRTLVGRSAGVEPLLNVRFPQALNAEVDGLRYGNRKEVAASLTGWDQLYDRPIFDAIP